jgi:hypothetical protein
MFHIRVAIIENVPEPKKTRKHKRCPNGERRNKITKKCEKIK